MFSFSQYSNPLFDNHPGIIDYDLSHSLRESSLLLFPSMRESRPFYGVSYTSGIVEAVERTQEHASVHATGNFLASSHASILTYSILEENMDWCMLKFSF